MGDIKKNFYWGSATSSHQVEGETRNDWSKWEKKNAERLARESKTKWELWQQKEFPEMFFPENYISAKACDQYHRYEEDFDLLKEGGQNAYRFSIEWSRVEPEEGKFDKSALQHYVDVVKALRVRGIEPFVTLWHWTLPVWLSDKGGLLSGDFSEFFARYCEKVAEALREDVVFFMTVNEPNSIILGGYARGVWPPQKRNIFLALRAYRSLAQAHKKAYQKIKEISPESQVGCTEIFMLFEAGRKYSFFDQLMVRFAWKWGNEQFLSRIVGSYDFLGVQNYFSVLVGIFWFQRKSVTEDTQKSDLGWRVHPEGLGKILRECVRYNVPLYVTEDGLADADDRLRGEFLRLRIAGMQKAREDGVDVRGYFYWSLLDNFEWDKGFWPRFGLIEVERKTLERRPRKSFYEYRRIIEA